MFCAKVGKHPEERIDALSQSVGSGKAENAYGMVQNATLKEVEDGYAMVSTCGSRVLSETTLEDKAHVVLMTPAGSLLLLVPHRFNMPCPGLERMGPLPVKGSQELEPEYAVGSQALSSTL